MSGLKIQVLKTTEKTDEKGATVLVDGAPVLINQLDADGREIVLYEIEVPREIEAEGFAAVAAHVEEESIKQVAALAAQAAMDAAPPVRGVADVAFQE